MIIKRPLKAPSKPIQDLASLQPVLESCGMLASYKEDGIRCLITAEGAMSQWMKKIPNIHVQEYLSKVAPKFLDGELVTFTAGVQDDFHTVQSKIMSRGGYPDFRFLVFDSFHNVYEPYEDRWLVACQLVSVCAADTANRLRWLNHTWVKSVDSIRFLEEEAISERKEGLMLRHPRGWYKQGRSTFNEAYLLKVKRFLDDEATVIAVEEEMQNCNLATRDAGGLTKRSKHAAGMVGKGCVGTLVCNWKGKTIRISSGITTNDKYFWWAFPDKIIGQRVSFKYQPHGMVDLPRSPIFRGVRKD